MTVLHPNAGAYALRHFHLHFLAMRWRAYKMQKGILRHGRGFLMGI
jgi:hypothetical protein